MFLSSLLRVATRETERRTWIIAKKSSAALNESCPDRGDDRKSRNTGGRKSGRIKVAEVGVPRAESTFPHLLSLKPNRD